MSNKPSKTRYQSNSPSVLKMALEMAERLNQHDRDQQELLRESEAKSQALTDRLEEIQSATFKAMAAAMGVPAEDFEDCFNWALKLGKNDTGPVELVHLSDKDVVWPNQAEDEFVQPVCNCPVCRAEREASQKHTVH